MSNHTLHVRITGQGDAEFWFTCPADHYIEPGGVMPRPVPNCTTWTTSPCCLCDCLACKEGEHGDCLQDGVSEIGRKWCEAMPTGKCFYTHALEEVGVEMLNIVTFLEASWDVDANGWGWDEPVDVVGLDQ